MEATNKFPLGHLPSPPDERDIVYSSVVPVGVLLAAEPLPVKFSYRGYIPAIKNQGSLGSCVGQSIAGAWSTRYNYRNKDIQKKIDYSPRFIYSLSKQNDGIKGEGTVPRVAMQVLNGVGEVKESTYPETPGISHEEYIRKPDDKVIEEAQTARSSGYLKLETIEDIKHALVDQGPLCIAVNVFEDYLECNELGIVQKPKGAWESGHYIYVIGWDDSIQCLEVVNSWGNQFGELVNSRTNERSGVGWLPYTYGFSDAYTPTTSVDGIATGGAPVGLIHPVDMPPGRLGQAFGENPEFYSQYGLNGHNGRDYPTPVGTPVKAIDAGKVVYAARKGAYGLAVIVQTAWGGYILGHLSELAVSVEQTVSKGQIIGKSGGAKGDPNAGNSSGPHVHRGGWINGVKNPGYNDYVDLDKYTKNVEPAQPDKGFALINGGPGQLFYFAASSMDGWKDLAREHGEDLRVYGSIKNVSSYPDSGFAIGNNGKTVFYFFKLSSLDEKALLKRVFRIKQDDAVLPVAENL